MQQKRAELDTYVIFTTINDLLHSDTVQPKNNARARISFCSHKKKFFLQLIADALSLSPGNHKNFFAAAW